MDIENQQIDQAEVDENNQELEGQLDETFGDESEGQVNESQTDEGADCAEGAEGEDGSDDSSSTFYTQEQVESAIKTRVSTFNKKIERMKPYESAVKKISDLTGMDVTTLISRLESMSITDQAKVLGVTPEELQHRKLSQQSESAAKAEADRLRRELEEQKLTSDPAYRDYPLFKEEINDLLEDNPRLTVKQAYMLVKGDSGIKAVKRDAEQRAVARMTKSSNQSVVKPGSSKSNSAPKISPVVVQAAKKVGMDPAEYAAYSNITSMDDYEKLMSRKKK